MNKKIILEYIRTIIIALIIALVIAGVATACSKVIAEHHVKALSRITNTKRDDEMIMKLINHYKQEELQNAGNYIINVRLGNLYELMLDYPSAEVEYQKAINKSPYGAYSPYFGLANLYLKEKKYKEAVLIVKSLKNTNYKPLLIAKGDFYMNLGDLLWQDQKYEDAVTQYKLAFFFYKKVDSDKKDSAISGILDCYNKIADIDFEHRSIEKAIESLETALLYKETPIFVYKLALLYKDFDPVKSNEYFEKIYKMDPGLINYDIYEEVLISLIQYYYRNGMDIETELYSQKLKSIKSFQKRYVITEEDVKVNIDELKIKNNFLKTKQKVFVKFKIENTSRYDFNTLYLTVNVKYDDKSKTIFQQRLYSKKEPLKSRTESEQYSFNFGYKDKDAIYQAEKVWLEFYVSKKENMRKIPVYSVELQRF